MDKKEEMIKFKVIDVSNKASKFKVKQSLKSTKRLTSLDFEFLIRKLYGKEPFYEIKGSQNIQSTKKYYLKLLGTFLIAIVENVKVSDKFLIEKLNNIIEEGKNYLTRAKDLTDLDVIMINTQTRLLLQLLGEIPDNTDKQKVTNHNSNWILDSERSLNITSNLNQKKNILKSFLISKLSSYENYRKFDLEQWDKGFKDDYKSTLSYLKLNNENWYLEFLEKMTI